MCFSSVCHCTLSITILCNMSTMYDIASNPDLLWQGLGPVMQGYVGLVRFLGLHNRTESMEIRLHAE